MFLRIILEMTINREKQKKGIVLFEIQKIPQLIDDLNTCIELLHKIWPTRDEDSIFLVNLQEVLFRMDDDKIERKNENFYNVLKECSNKFLK
jgi:hypothetical protein